MSTLDKRPKILVEIIGAIPRKLKLPIDDGKIVVKEATAGRRGAAITATFDNTCLVPYWAGIPPFRTIKYKLLLKEGATECISFGNRYTKDAPTCTLSDVQKFGQATVIKLAGALRNPNNMNILYLLVIVAIIIGVINIFVASGNIRL
jgi:hypothetical protein